MYFVLANDLFRRRVIIPENYSSSLKFGDPLINSRVPKNRNDTIRKFIESLQLSYENEYEVDQHSTDRNWRTEHIGPTCTFTPTTRPRLTSRSNYAGMYFWFLNQAICLNNNTRISHTRTRTSLIFTTAPQQIFCGRFIPHCRPYKIIKQEPETREVD